MTWANLRKVVRYLHAVAGPPSSAGPTDAQLLDRYVGQRDEAAFELLLWRHGTMVLNVCRRILHDEHDAEDAFQATFLAFVRKARSIVRHEAVACWLYRVAYRVALEARSKVQKRSQREKHGLENLAVVPVPEATWQELRPLLDEEMNRLPEQFRLPLVLCYLEGKTNEEAARQLGCRPGTIYSRLSRGRDLLRRRLVRRGLVLSAGALTTLLSQNAASAAVPTLLVGPTFKAALAFAAAQTAAGTASARVIALAEGVLKAMYLTKLKTVAALVLVVGVLLAGGIVTRRALQAAPQQEANQDKLIKPDETPKPGQEVKKGPVVVQVTTPRPGGLERTTTTAGTVRAMGEARIFGSVSGTLKNQTVDIGDRVRRGQLLAEIDAPLLVLDEKQAAVAVRQAKGLLQEAESRCQQARAEVDVAKTVIREKEASLDGAKASVTFQHQQNERIKRLLQSAAVSQEDVAEKARLLESARAQVTAAEAALANAKADMKVKESKVAQAEAALETARASLELAELVQQKAQYSASLTRIVAPFDGVVTQRNYLPGDTVHVGDRGDRQPLLTVTRMDSVRVVVGVPERDVPLTEVGQHVELQINSLPGKRWIEKVSRIGVVEDENTKTMRVEIDVPNRDGLLRPGMYGQVKIDCGKGPADALRIPASALLPRPKGPPTVYVVRDSKAHRTTIEISWQDGKEVEVRSGLKPTDHIVIDPKGLKGDVVPVEIEKEPKDK
ncbi:MAG TPA: efflux RND transporter periplasmic adaptor subunit [Gemmataceae bacterium]|nr:efflux RND transporter periplasmic adaptor subunit [Gemmataceae bacterium]